eukprot:274531-Pleurochrysis_carterae.AAC.1
MPNEKGVLVHEVCVWLEVYKEEFIPEMRLIGVAWGREEGGDGSIATWRDGKTRALLAFAEETYGDGSAPFKLRSRSRNSTFKECEVCQTYRLKLKTLIQGGALPAEICALKADMRDHVRWFMGQRKALHNMRLEAGRHDTIFEQAGLHNCFVLQCVACELLAGDKCGNESPYLPGGGRLTGTDQSKYIYRLSLQANFFSCSLWQLNFLLPNLRTGTDFGVTALFAGLVRSMELGSITRETRRLLRGSD